jgi:hypothetical protein
MALFTPDLSATILPGRWQIVDPFRLTHKTIAHILPIRKCDQNDAKFFNGLTHPAFGYVSGWFTCLEIEFFFWYSP